MLPANTRRRCRCRAAARFHFSGSFQCSSLKNRRRALGPQTS